MNFYQYDFQMMNHLKLISLMYLLEYGDKSYFLPKDYSISLITLFTDFYFPESLFSDK